MEPAPGRVEALARELRSLPKAELHLHLDGSLRPATAVELAGQAGMPLTLDEARERMVAPDRCASQAHLLEYFTLPIALLQTREALARAASELVADLAADGVSYAEIRWAPRLHLERGLGVRDVIEAVALGTQRGRQGLGGSAPVIGLIVTAMRHHPPAANVLLAREACAVGPPVVGFDLAGPEDGWPAPPHAAAFVAAAEGGLGLTAHAGEVPGVAHVREVLDLGVTRIAHGVTAAGDPELVGNLIARSITLDLCPTSNVQAGVVPDLAAHPLVRLHRQGVSVTCSTDDRVVSATTLSAELARAAIAMRMTRPELSAIARNAFRRAFAPDRQLRALAADAEARWAEWERRDADSLS